MRGGYITALLLAYLSSAGCHAPTLWLGTARSDAGELLPVAEVPPRDVGRLEAEAGAPAPAVTAGLASRGAEPTADPALVPPEPARTDAGAVSPVDVSDADAGTGDAGAVASDGGAGVTHSTWVAPVPQRLPAIEGQCPDLNGPGTYTFQGGGRSLTAELYMQPSTAGAMARGGPLVLYFHAFGSSSNEVASALGQAAIDSVVAEGGVVAAFNASPCLRCGLADDVVWYDEDDAVSDQVVACAVAQRNIDTRRIHAVGFSAGALHAMHLVLARSDFIASVISYSGGMPLTQPEPQDPDNKVAALLSFGRAGVDNAVADFNVASHDWYDTYAPRGYYVLLCDHDGGHMIPPDLALQALRFLNDHPYRVDPEPYLSDLPVELPSYCRNGPGK